ncbi:uncharacterized protein BT62DRAFT_788569 [Guyanagaster necrorhizus]|uniref:Uncharacterized protein n=1 Tax=Guyanagaster necrorhizus TaxID=856835 RepID=A0A9P7VXL4_9AGAR|nr:uncharacterized protein BT62DRAFT_788569 [Guyanagaster necrorhizus MCA 3950]KAG7447686.1 hypothetical protein BT62DRAFT_788569 [Guyanagaster necrorhizus MCA 3950]
MKVYDKNSVSLNLVLTTSTQNLGKRGIKAPLLLFVYYCAIIIQVTSNFFCHPPASSLYFYIAIHMLQSN